jgi:hypothetical protein
MTDEEVLQFYNELLEHYGTLPNFEHEPLQFKALVRNYKYYKEQQNGRQQTTPDLE